MSSTSNRQHHFKQQQYCMKDRANLRSICI